MRLVFKFLLALLAVVTAHASAQSYRCSSGGRTHYSDRPCASELKSYGPAPERHMPDRYHAQPGMARAEEHVQHMGSGCAAISEAIRTGPARGVKNDVIRGLHEEYRLKCSMDDQAARDQVRQERQQMRQAEVAMREQEAARKRQLAEQRDRCNGMRDVISVKRAREASLNPKEVEALRSLERTYNQVCIAL